MVKKTLVILLCWIASTLSMDSARRLEFMRNGAALSGTMTQQQRIEFMRNGRQIAQQLAQQPIPKETVPETKPVVLEKPVDQEENAIPQYVVDEDVSSTEDDIINHVIKLSLNDLQPNISEEIKSTDLALGNNIIINCNLTTNQKLKNSSQTINIGNKNKNK